jgi:hypothetical protein
VAPSPATVATNPPSAPAVLSGQTFSWKDVESDRYQTYLDSLRAVGCPEDKVRYIVLADIDDLMDEKRLQESIAHDQEWWKAEANQLVVNVLQDKGRTLEEERQKLITRWLGKQAVEIEVNESAFWSNVQLTGPVLGKLDKEQHKRVQDVCADSMDRHQSIFWSSINAGKPISKLDMANLREGTRSQLVKTLDGQELEEFLLRYSHNANNLRQDLRGFDPTPEEFREIFRVTDPMDHAMQLQYGSLEAMSPQQMELHLRLRDQAIKEVLSPERYEAYLLTKDPLYKQALTLARQYGAPATAIMPLYELSKDNQMKRDSILQNPNLTPAQKQQALQQISLDQRMAVQRIVTEARNKARTQQL